METVMERDVYLPPGGWYDYQSGRRYVGGKWHRIQAGAIPCVILVRDGAALPRLKLAQSTQWMDWKDIELIPFGSGETARGLLAFPGEGRLHEVALARQGGAFALAKAPRRAEVRYRVSQ
jgi:alpha-D-xyloside xylohydrolase